MSKQPLFHQNDSRFCNQELCSAIVIANYVAGSEVKDRVRHLKYLHMYRVQYQLCFNCGGKHDTNDCHRICQYCHSHHNMSYACHAFINHRMADIQLRWDNYDGIQTIQDAEKKIAELNRWNFTPEDRQYFLQAIRFFRSSNYH